MKIGQRIDPSDYVLPEGLSDGEVLSRLGDPLVRICNLYSIEDADGKAVKFVPNRAQCEVLHAVFVDGVRRIAIPKARQLGFSTLIALVQFDTVHFCVKGSSLRGVIIDKSVDDAQAKLAKIKFAWERLPKELQDKMLIANKGAIEFENGSSISAGMKARGRTPQVVHISEWGPIAHRDPIRSAEIVTGVLQAASGDKALIFAESTHEGGKGGDWYELLKRSLETPEEHRTSKDFRVMFFPWYMEPRYTESGNVEQVDREVREYLAGKELEIQMKGGVDFRFTDGQKLFYYKKRRELGRKIYAEFPTTLEESWMTPIVGAIYGPEVDKARLAGRIGPNVMHYEGFPVYTTFDIGAPTNTICWLWQIIGDRINYLECLRGGDDCNTPGDWARRLKAKTAYTYGGHFLPHDGETLWARLLRESELRGVVCLPRPTDVWDNINDALTSFSRCFFHGKGCEWGINSLEAYRAKEEGGDTGTVKNVPVHDWASHASTAFGYTHQVIRLGLCVDRSAMPVRPKAQMQRRPQSLTGLASWRKPRVIR